MPVDLRTCLKWTVFLKDQLSKMHTEKIENLNSLIWIKDIEFIIKPSTKKTPGTDGFTGKFY